LQQASSTSIIAKVMWQEWSSHLTEAHIKFKPELSLTEYLSTVDDLLSWQSNFLFYDTATTEKSIMLKRLNRYPLIIDRQCGRGVEVVH